jgi:hypothetical protein
VIRTASIIVIALTLQALSAEEIAEANASQQNPLPLNDPLHFVYQPFDPGNWTMPTFSFPKSYLSFLRWSNGGNFTKGCREFGFFPAIDSRCGVRAMMLAYQIPEYMKNAVPFAFDGAGSFYLFDMRRPPVDDEFPIVLSHAGSLGWDENDHERLADSFVDALSTKSTFDTPHQRSLSGRGLWRQGL